MEQPRITPPLWGILIGRFQPFHDGHAYLVKRVLEECDGLVMVLGSAGGPRTLRNPWSFAERCQMIRAGLPADLHSRVRMCGIPDVFYEESRWLQLVTEGVEATAPADCRIRLYGHTKDASSYYLKLFPSWEYQEEPNYQNLSATPIREAILASDPEKVDALIDLLPDVEMPAGTREWLKRFGHQDDYRELLKEAHAVRAYKAQWKGSPYEPMFVTVDALVTCGDEVLLIRRGGRPGRGLLALPGGFLDPDERLEAAARRELEEETGLSLGCAHTPAVHFVADHPDRSDRGRFVTHVFHFELDSRAGKPSVKGGDDAASASWWPLADLPANELFEDHLQILHHVLGREKLPGASVLFTEA